MPELLHLVVTSSIADSGSNNVWHTIRRPNGTWLPFGDVEAQTGDQGRFEGVDCDQNRLVDLHVCGVTSDRRLWHTVRRSDRSWVAFGDVAAQAGDREGFTHVACTSTYYSSQPPDSSQPPVLVHELHVLAINSWGRLWHTIRRGDGSWMQFGNVEAQAGAPYAPGGVFDVACDAEPLGGAIHVFAVARSRIWHTIRRADGSWTQFDNINVQASDPGRVESVDVATRLTNFPEGVLPEYEIHVCAVTQDGRLWHTIRDKNGAWTQFRDVEAQAGDLGDVSGVACAIADTGGEPLVLHVVGVTKDSHLGHTIRSNNGSWTQFGDVERQASVPGRRRRLLFRDPSVARIIV
jgi:hypothetical protein